MATSASDSVPNYGRMQLSEARRELAYQGAHCLSDEDLVRIILGHEVPPVPSAISLRKLGLSELASLPGMTQLRAERIKAALELGRRAQLPEPLWGYVVRSAEDVGRLLRAELADGEQEALHVFGLDAHHRIRCRHLAALGQVDRVQVGIADVFRPLVREAMAAALVAHNHPSGDPTPSPQDELLTLKIAQMGQALGIPLLDHVVVSREGHYSFADAGKLGGLGPRERELR